MGGILPAALSALTFALLATGKKALEGSPHVYTNAPGGAYGPQWQSYFEVTAPLPGVNFNLGTHYAGNLPVQRAGHADDSLFFWAFEHTSGSLTSTGTSEPWAVWLQGGPGSSSMFGLFTENGPMRMAADGSISANNYSWSGVMDYIWVDGPVGVGYSTADNGGFAADEEQAAADFIGFLENLVAVFPGLAQRPFYLTGESYAARYISYTAQALFASTSPPVRLAKIVVGDGAFGSDAEFKTMPTLSLIETYPQLIGYDTTVYEYFKEQTHLCGLDINLTYPQTGGPFPPVVLAPGSPLRVPTTGPVAGNDKRKAKAKAKKSLRRKLHDASVWSRHKMTEGRNTKGQDETDDDLEDGLMMDVVAMPKTQRRRRDLGGRANGTIDSWYGCNLFDELVDYALNFTEPWHSTQQFDMFDVPDGLSTEVEVHPATFMNDPAVRAALHAPTDVVWAKSVDYPWSGGGGDPSPESMTFLSNLASSASAQGVSIVLYVGNDDPTSPHFGTEVTIQNTTFGGTQGFTRKPSTPWFDDAGNWAGIIHQERNWTYALVYGAGHEVAAQQPAAMFTFIRDYVLGTLDTGLVTTSGLGPGASVSVAGGEDAALAPEVLPGAPGIATGSATTAGFYTDPTATVAAWNLYLSVTPFAGSVVPPSPTSATSVTPRSVHSAARRAAGGGGAAALGCLVLVHAACAAVLLRL